MKELPVGFICVWKFGRKKSLIKVHRWLDSNGVESWCVDRWNVNGYWSRNGGGQITRSLAEMYFRDGNHVYEVISK